MRPHNPYNTDRLTHYLECERLWRNIHRAYKKYANIQLTHSRFHALCIIPPWELETTPKELTHHLICLGAAVDTYNYISSKQKYLTGKCHARGDTNPHKVDNRTIASAADDAFRRINRLSKIPKIQPPNANTYRSNRGSSSPSSSSSSSSSTNNSNNNDIATHANDGQLRVTSSSKPHHGHSSNNNINNDKHDLAASPDDGQLRVTSSSKPPHGHNNSSTDKRDNHDLAPTANDGQLRATSSSKSHPSREKEEPRALAEESKPPAKDSVQHTRPYAQARLPPQSPSVGELGECMFPFETISLD